MSDDGQSRRTFLGAAAAVAALGASTSTASVEEYGLEREEVTGGAFQQLELDATRGTFDGGLHVSSGPETVSLVFDGPYGHLYVGLTPEESRDLRRSLRRAEAGTEVGL